MKSIPTSMTGTRIFLEAVYKRSGHGEFGTMQYHHATTLLAVEKRDPFLCSIPLPEHRDFREEHLVNLRFFDVTVAVTESGETLTGPRRNEETVAIGVTHSQRPKCWVRNMTSDKPLPPTGNWVPLRELTFTPRPPAEHPTPKTARMFQTGAEAM